MSDIEKLTPIQYEIVKQIANYIFRKVPNSFDINLVLSSWGDSMPESWVLDSLIEINEKEDKFSS